MSAYDSLFRIRKSPPLSLLTLFGSVLLIITMQCILSTTVLASSTHSMVSSPLSEDVARAGVSVVRLLVSYTTLTSPPSTVQCTGLGTIVASWPSQNLGDQNNWVLTDGALVNQHGEAGCVPTHPQARLDSIEVLLSTAYNSKAGEQGTVIPLRATTTSPLTIQCATPEACQNGPALLAFPTPQTLPFIDLAAGELAPADSTGIELLQKADAALIPAAFNTDAKAVPSYTAQVLQSSIPSRVTLNLASNTAPIDPGLPLVDVHGNLLSIALKSVPPPTHQGLTTFLTQQPALRSHPANPLHDHWQAGITAFYQGPSHYAQAHSEFQAVLTSNPQFLGAQPFLHLTAPTTGSASPPNWSSQVISFSHSLLSMLAIGSGVLLGVIILLALVTFVRRRARQKRLQEEYAEAERIVNAQFSGEESQKQQQQAGSQPPKSAQQDAPTATPPLKAEPLPTPDSHCPRCGVSVPKSAKYCPKCSLQLLPSPSIALPPPKPQIPVTPVSSIAEVGPVVPVQVHTLSGPEWPVSEKPVVSPGPAEPSRVLASKEEAPSYPKVEVELKKMGRVGQKLGNYRLVGLIGYGGFAEVYLGEHRFLKTQAAIKVLQKRLTRDALLNFLAEARTVADLVHPHIVRVLEFGVEGSEPDIEQSISDGDAMVGGIPFLVMDYAPGGTLRKRHPKGTRLPLATIIPYITQVADALQYAHGKKLIHRDIKPENILIGRNNEILLSDFGIAAVAHSEQSMTTQEMAGTIPYMAPEQIQGKPRPASDQYALGVIVYEWLCGVRPFSGASMEVAMQHITISPPRLREHVPSIAPKVEEVVLKALAKDPLQRFESVRAFADALKASE